MTREEAIKELKIFSGTTRIRLSANFWEALNTVIKALEQEPCEDAVSRELKIGDEIYIRTNVNEIRKDYIICENAGGYFGTVREEIKSSVTPTQRWIPCSERLPKESGFYLVSTTDCITIMEFCKGWISQNIGSCNWYVKAWMSLPSGYKGE